MLSRIFRKLLFFSITLEISLGEVAFSAENVVFDGCVLNVPKSFELVRNDNGRLEFAKFGFPKFESIELIKFSGDFLSEEFKGIPIKIVKSFEFNNVKAVIFDTLGLKENLNIRYLLIESDSDVVLLTSFDPTNISEVFGSCFTDENMNQIKSAMINL
jgi:hypothetical protein